MGSVCHAWKLRFCRLRESDYDAISQPESQHFIYGAYPEYHLKLEEPGPNLGLRRIEGLKLEVLKGIQGWEQGEVDTRYKIIGHQPNLLPRAWIFGGLFARSPRYQSRGVF